MATPGNLRRRLSIGIVLIGSLLIMARVAGLALEARDEDAPAPQRPTAAKAGSAHTDPASAPEAPVLALDRLDAHPRHLAGDPPAAPGTRLFAAVSWTPPAPPAPAPPPPPPPVAPPFPYAYVGGLRDGAERTLFFSKGEQLVALRVGDTVDGSYRVERILDHHMLLTFTPLGQSIQVPIGGRR